MLFSCCIEALTYILQAQKSIMQPTFQVVFSDMAQ